MKQINTKRILAYVVYQNLKSTPPKEFPDINEMVETVDNILPALQPHVTDFIQYRKDADEVSSQLAAGTLTKEAAADKMTNLQKEVNKYETERGDEPVVIEMEGGTYNVFKTLFERWGKNWFNKIEDFVQFRKDLAKTDVPA
jgi:hypothetical protein